MANDNSSSAASKPLATTMLLYLIEKYGVALGIPSSLVDRVRFFEPVASDQAMRRWLTGKTEKQGPQHKKQIAVIHLFRRAEPALPDGCFSMTAEQLESFLDKNRTAIGSEDVVSLAIPGHAGRAKRVKTFLPGVYVTYRYAFESEAKRLVSREVLHIQDDLSFLMSFHHQVDQKGQTALTFRGKVLPLGESLFFAGVSVEQPVLDRGRSIFVYNEVEPGICDAKLGILTGTRLKDDHGPCTAVTLILRVDPDIASGRIGDFIQNVTLNDHFSSIMEGDFGKDKHRINWLKSCLSNRQKGTTLRVNQKRFSERMRRELPAIKNDPSTAGAPYRSPQLYLTRTT
jgi:hypothetical protein